jgi:hypothetical protein
MVMEPLCLTADRVRKTGLIAGKRRTVLDLLAVALRLVQSLDDLRRGSVHQLDGGLAVLHDELDSALDALHGGGCLCNIIGNLLRGLLRDSKRPDQCATYCSYQTKRADLGGKRGNVTGLTANAANNH